MAANAESESGREDGGPRRPPPSRVKAPDCVLAMGARRRHNGGGWPREQTRCSAGGGGSAAGPADPRVLNVQQQVGFGRNRTGERRRERGGTRVPLAGRRGGGVWPCLLSQARACVRARGTSVADARASTGRTARAPSPRPSTEGRAVLACRACHTWQPRRRRRNNAHQPGPQRVIYAPSQPASPPARAWRNGRKGMGAVDDAGRRWWGLLRLAQGRRVPSVVEEVGTGGAFVAAPPRGRPP